MINTNPYAKYQQSQVQTASPEKLLVMLYDGAIKFLGQSKTTLEEKDFEKTNYFIGRTQDIIAELMSSLNMDYEISTNLYALYDFMYFSLINANVKKDKNLIEEVQKMLIELRDVWVEASLVSKSQAQKVANGVNFSG